MSFLASFLTMPENTAIPLEQFAWHSNAKITYYANELASLFLMIIRMDKQLILSVSLIAFIVRIPLTTTKPYLDTALVSLWLSISLAYLEVKYLSPTKNRWLPLQSGYSYSSFTLYHFIKSEQVRVLKTECEPVRLFLCIWCVFFISSCQANAGHNPVWVYKIQLTRM